MKNKGLILSTVLLAVVVVATAIHSAMGAVRDGAVPIDQGDSNLYRVVSISSTSGTALWVADPMMVDSICRVNGGNTIWIGSTTVAQHGRSHANVQLGLFLLSSETITMGGAYSGQDYATCGVGVSSCEMRCRDSRRSY